MSIAATEAISYAPAPAATATSTTRPATGAPATAASCGGAGESKAPSSSSSRDTAVTEEARALVELSAEGFVVESGDVGAVASFDAMPLTDSILRGIYAVGFEKPSPIQQRAIVPIAAGRDVLAQAQSGTGKTGTFTIGVLARIDTAIKVTQAVILCPTRELATQTEEVVRAIGGHAGATVHACIGGTDIAGDALALRAGVHVVVGTPGRIKHVLRQRLLDMSGVRVAVVDEADQMLDKGFEEELPAILRTLPERASIALLSATMPPHTLEVARTFLRDPAIVLVKAEQVNLKGIRQYNVMLDRDADKLDVLCDLYDSVSIVRSIVFVRTKERAEALAAEMTRREFTVSCIHADMSMRERSTVMAEFRGGATRVLIATDLLARGIDVQQISVVFNFDLPADLENYLHRVGRAGRFGRKGAAINLLTPRDVAFLRALEREYDIRLPDLPADLCVLSG